MPFAQFADLQVACKWLKCQSWKGNVLCIQRTAKSALFKLRREIKKERAWGNTEWQSRVFQKLKKAVQISSFFRNGSQSMEVI